MENQRLCHGIRQSPGTGPLTTSKHFGTTPALARKLRRQVSGGIGLQGWVG